MKSFFNYAKITFSISIAINFIAIEIDSILISCKMATLPLLQEHHFYGF